MPSNFTVAVNRHSKTGEIIHSEICPNLNPMTHAECVTFISKQSRYEGRSFMVVQLGVLKMAKKQPLYVSVENLAQCGVLPYWLTDANFSLQSVQIIRHLKGDDLMKALQFVEGNPYNTDKGYCFLVAMMGALESQSVYSEFYSKVYNVLTGDLEKNYSEARSLSYELSDFARANYQGLSDAKLWEIFIYEYICQWVLEKYSGTFSNARMNISFLNIYKFSVKLKLAAETLLREYFE